MVALGGAYLAMFLACSWLMLGVTSSGAQRSIWGTEDSNLFATDMTSLNYLFVFVGFVPFPAGFRSYSLALCLRIHPDGAQDIICV